MRAFIFPLLATVLFGGIDLDLGLPPQPDLDLPILPEHYDPSNPAPGPVPSGQDDQGDPRDEPPPVFYGEEIDTPSDSIFYVVDFSCSMFNDERDDKAKAEFARSVIGLPTNLRFNVVVYNCELILWSKTMQSASEENKQAAIAFVMARNPSSGTGTGPAVGLALRTDMENMAIVLLTDGEPNCGAEGMPGHRAMIKRLNTQGATITVFGIAAGTPWRNFCIDVATDSGGSYFDVP